MGELQEKHAIIGVQKKNAQRVVWPDNANNATNRFVFQLAEHLRWVLTYCCDLEDKVDKIQGAVTVLQEAKAEKPKRVRPKRRE